MTTLTDIGSVVPSLVGAVLLLTGLALAFAGHRIWEHFMGLIGIFVGGAIGYLASRLLDGLTLILILVVVGAIVGSLLFAFVVKVALSILAGTLSGVGTFLVLGGTLAPPVKFQDPALWLAVVVLVAVTGVMYYFIDELIALATALVGGALTGGGTYLLALSAGGLEFLPALILGLLGGGVVFVAGAIRQVKRAAGLPG